MVRQTIKDFYGKIIGHVDTDDKTGNKTAFDFYGRILGYYKKTLNTTSDFYGKIISRGDTAVALVYDKEEKRKR